MTGKDAEHGFPDTLPPRRRGITLSLKADYPAEELIRQLREGGIRILVTDIIGNQARVGIEAPRGVLIVRDELKTAPKG